MKYPIIILIFTILFSGTITEQEPDILYFDNKKINIEVFPLEQRIKSDSTLRSKIQNNITCMSTACWRGVIGVYKIHNKKFYLVGLKEPCKKKDLKLEKFFNKSEIKENRVFVNWFKGEISGGFGKEFFDEKEFEMYYENEIYMTVKDGILADYKISKRTKK